MFEMRLSQATKDDLEREIDRIMDTAYDYGYGGEIVFSRYQATSEIIELFEYKLVEARKNGGL